MSRTHRRFAALGLLLLLLVGGAVVVLVGPDPARAPGPDPAAAKDEGGAPAAAEGAAVAAARLQGREPAPTEPTRGARLRVRAIEGEGAPVAGAAVLVGPVGDPDPAHHRRLGTTEADGRLHRAWPDDAATALRVVVESPRHAPALAVATTADETETTLHLLTARHLVLEVRDAGTNEPIAGVVCRTSTIWAGHEIWGRFDGDEDGRVRLRRPQSDRFGHTWIRLRAPGYRPRDVNPSVLPRTNPPVVYLRRGAGFALVIVDEGDRPVEGAEAAAWSGRTFHLPIDPLESLPRAGLGTRTFLGSGRSDAKGHVVLGIPRGGDPVFARAWKDDRVGILSVHGAGMGDEAPRRVVLRPTLRLAVRVVNESGTPVPGALVRCTPASGPADPRSGGPAAPPSHGSTDEAGRIEFPTAAVGRQGKLPLLLASHPQHGAGNRQIEPADVREGRAECNVVLSAQGTPVRIRVKDPAGAPIEGALAQIGESYPCVPTDARGEVVLARLFRGPAFVRVRKDGYAHHRETEDAGGVVEVVLRPAARLRGRARTEADEPVAAHLEVYVDLGPNVAPRQVNVLDPRCVGRGSARPDGTFEIGALPPAPWTVKARRHVRDDDGRSRPQYLMVRVDDPDDELVLRFPVTAAPLSQSVAGEIRDAEGQRRTEYRLYLARGDQYVWPRLQGWQFRFDDVVPGLWNLHVEVDGRRHAQALPVRAGRDVEDLVVWLRATATLRGRITGPEGWLAEGVRVLVHSTEDVGQGAYGAAVGRDGTFVVSGLPAGRYVVALGGQVRSRACWQIRAPELDLTAGEDLHRSWAALRAGRIALLLDDDRFAPDVGEAWRDSDPASRHSREATVEITTASGRVLRRRGLARGRHVLPHALLPGTCRVRVQTSAQGTFESGADVTAGKTTDLEVRLHP